MGTTTEATETTTGSHPPPPLPPPDGGYFAWTQVALAWLSNFNTWGFVNSFGAFQTYYTSVLPESPSTISWIGSTQAFLVFSVGTFTGRLLDAGYFRSTVIVGVVVQIVGIFCMSISTQYWHLLLTHGFCTGLGGGIYFVPIMGVVSTYFEKNRGLALGLVTTGTSVGGMIYPVIVQQLIAKVGFGWTVRVLGFMNVVCLTAATIGMRPRLTPKKGGPMLDWSAFRDVPYMLHALGLCFLMPPVYFAFYYVGSYARDSLGLPYKASLNLVILLNGVGLPARIGSGFIADRVTGPLNMFGILVVVGIVILWSWLAVRSIAGFYAWTVVYGISVASFQSMYSTTVAAYVDDLSKIGSRFGMAFMGMGLATLVAGPVSGAFLKIGGGYVAPICWNGGLMVLGTTAVISARIYKHGWSLTTFC